MDRYELMTTEEVINKLNTNINTGLPSSEIGKRRAKYGKNILPKEKTRSILKIALSELLNSITIIMIIACIFSFLIGEIVDGIAIIFIILVDIIMGTMEEKKAEKTARSLTEMIKVNARVIRNEKEMVIDSKDLVVGDIILLESGDKVPADSRIITSSNLTVNESSLTGESNATSKNAHISKEDKTLIETKNILYASTSIMTGRAKCIVINVGTNTEIGKIATKVMDTKEEPSPLAKRMNKFTKQISIVIVIVSILLIIMLYLKGIDYKEIFLSVVALSVSALPEGLPLALTLALTIGARRMSKKNVVVKKLNAVEALGSCTVIASDKTGTLTVNEQTLKKIITPDNKECEVSGTGYNDIGIVTGPNLEVAYDIAKYGVLNNESGLSKEKNGKWNSYGDSIDIAFLAYGKKCKIDISNITKLASIPYESENKYSAVFYKENDKTYVTVKGSYEVVLDFCDKMKIGNTYKKIDKDLIIKQNEQLAKSGYRVIGIATKEISSFKEKDFYSKKDIPKLNFIGLCAFIDPIRKDVTKGIAECKNLGIKVVMITGDHPLTAFTIAKELKITDDYNEVTTGDEIEKYYNYGIKDFDKFVKNKKVFTRVTPLQKLQIVESYKRQKEYVAVTGDGVNDAPALKVADIGVSMGSGTDVAKETSNMIIIDDNFNSIVNAVYEGRIAYSNIRKVVYMLLSCGLSEVLSFTLAILFNLPMPLVAVQLLWLNIVTDGLQDFALSFEKEKISTKNVNQDKLFDKTLIEEVLISGLFIGLLIFITYVLLLKVFKFDVVTSRGYIMTLMVFIQNIHVLNCRSETISAFKIPLKDNILIAFSIISSILLQFIIMEIDKISIFFKTSSIPFWHIVFLFLASIPIIFVMEMYKMKNQNKN